MSFLTGLTLLHCKNAYVWGPRGDAFTWANKDQRLEMPFMLDVKKSDTL